MLLVVQTQARLQGLARRIERSSRHGRRQRAAYGCREKIRQELGWQPQERFETGLRKTVEWYLQNMDWTKNVTSGNYRNWLELNYSERERT